jgi:tRNA threonylcarbamoyl adenosine modification protein YjeE
MAQPLSILLADEAATAALARELAPCLRHGDVVALHGDLGAGKTSFARGLIRSLTGASEEAPSPTFTLMQTYESAIGPVHHFDLYRIAHPDELVEIGFEEALGDGVVLIEWPDRAGSWLPERRLDVLLGFGVDAGVRVAQLIPRGVWADNRPEFATLQRRMRGE